jgi:hypothetical protein
MRIGVFAFALVVSTSSFATGLATCDSGEPSTWQTKDALKAKLSKAGWEVRLIKEDGGCYEVYAMDENKARTEAYFHPVTLERVKLEEKH